MTDHIVGAEAARAEIAAARAEGRRIDLGRADLYGAYLGGADLGGAYLYGADLTGADLTGAYLTGADLTGAYLYGAYLYGADLTGANLGGAYLAGAWITGLPTVPWPTRVSGTTMAIGCQVHAHAEWAAFDDERIAAMHPDALAFWGQWRTHLLALCDAAAAWLAVMRPAAEDASGEVVHA